MADHIAGVIPDQGDLRSTRQQMNDARLVIAEWARDADDLRELLASLGLLDVKVCTKCREVKPPAEFHRSTAGRKSRCISCTLGADAARKAGPRAYDVAELAQLPEEELHAVLAAGGAPNP